MLFIIVNYQLLIKVGNQAIIIEDKSKIKDFVNLRVYKLSKAGNELYHIVNSSSNCDYNINLGHVVEETNKELFVSLSNIISTSREVGTEISDENLLSK